MFKKIGDYIASFTVLIIVFGLIKQSLYYSRFNLPIKYFINLSEIGLIISDDLLLISSFFACIILILAGSKALKWEEEKKRYEALEKRYDNLRPEEKNKVKRLQIGLMVIHAIFFIVVILLFVFGRDYFTKLLALIMFIAAFELTVLQFYKKIIYKHLTQAGLYNISILSFFLMTLIFKTGIDITSVEKGKFSGTKIITTDTTYLSTKANYFIGKTERFVFIYNTKDSTTTIIPNESVKRILLKSK